MAAPFPAWVSACAAPGSSSSSPPMGKVACCPGGLFANEQTSWRANSPSSNLSMALCALSMVSNIPAMIVVMRLSLVSGHDSSLERFQSQFGGGPRDDFRVRNGALNWHLPGGGSARRTVTARHPQVTSMRGARMRRVEIPAKCAGGVVSRAHEQRQNEHRQ